MERDGVGGRGSLSGSVVVGRRPDLASEDGVADDCVEQHQREDEETLAPEHEGETGVGCARRGRHHRVA